MRRFLPGTLTALLTVCWGSPAPAQGEPEQRPNVLWITVEDISPHIRSFGDPYAVTPHIDALAAEGVRYTHAFAPVGVCAPARSSLILGMYAPSAGTQHMRSRARLPEGVKLYSQLLRDAGYYSTNNVKQDYNLADVPDDAWDESSQRAHWRNRPDPEQPFFAIFNITVTHEAQIRLSEEDYQERTRDLAPHERHDPALARIPPYHPDTPEVRQDWARYADMITVMDRRVGAILRELEQDGLADDTIVFFYSDHGAGMPRSKRWLYESSLRVPLVVRFPDEQSALAPSVPGGLTDRLVDFTDFGPTLLSLAGVRPPATMQGRAFLGVHEAPPRRYTYAFRDRMDERYDMLRSVRDARYRYIRNYAPQKIYAQHIGYMFQMPTMRVWQERFDEGALGEIERRFFEPKSPEELYDTWADPHEIHNLAADAGHREVRDRMRRELRRWMLEIHDLGFLPEAEMHARAVGSTPYELARDPQRYDLPRILDVAERATLGEASSDELLALLRDDDSAVRYWAAVGMSGSPSLPEPSTAALGGALDDPSFDVRVAAAEALVAAGRHEQALPALVEALRHESPWVRLRAAVVLDELGERARPAREEMRQALRAWEEEDVPSWRQPYLPSVLEHSLANFDD